MNDKLTKLTQELEWATNIIRGQQDARNHSVVSVYLESGKITRAKIEISERPPTESLTALQK